MKNSQRFALIVIILLYFSCSPKNKSNQNGSFNDTLAVTKLLVQEIRKNLESQPDVDSIKEFSNGINRWEIWYRFDMEFWSGQSIELDFGDINGDGLNDAIAKIEYDESYELVGNRPWKDWIELYIERTADGYKVKDTLPLFGYRYVGASSIKDGLIELTGYDWANGDPRCCPSIKDEFKVKLVGETFEKVMNNSEQEASDPNAIEFEKAKLVADSIKQKFELEKHSLLKLTFSQESQTEERKSSSTYYFDSLFFIKYFVEISKHAGGEGELYKLYNWEGLTLRYSHISDASGSFITIWFNQHQYEETINASEDKKYKDDIVNDNGEEFGEWKQYTDNKTKQEFIYDTDSSWYKLTTQNAPDWSYELRVDSLLFVHLFGNK